MEKGKMFSGKRLLYWLLALIVTAAVVYFVIKSFNFFGQQGPCLTPENLEVVSTDTSEITIQWQRSTNALQYMVEIRDSLDLNTVLQDTVIADTSYTFRGLEKGRGYAMSVSSQCVGDNSEASRIGGTTQGRIIIEDVAHYDGPDCPESCEISIVLTSGCFPWADTFGLEYYQVEIIDNSDVLGQPTVRFHFAKNRASGSNDLYIWTHARCDVFADSIGTRPVLCTPGGSSLCGTLGASLNYQLNFDFTGCCITLPTGYSAVVKRCTTDE